MGQVLPAFLQGLFAELSLGDVPGHVHRTDEVPVRMAELYERFLPPRDWAELTG
jgi:hypothetical protein